MAEIPVIDAARKAVGLDRESILAEVESLIRSGMPDAVVMGFMKAKVDDLADRYSEAQWAEAGRIVDELGQTVHKGDPIKRARVEQFNQMFLSELRKRQGES
jgi:hypothetical protein